MTDWPNHPAAVKVCEYINGQKKMSFNVFLPAQTSWFNTTTFNLLLLGDNQWKWYLLIQWHFQGIRAHSWGRSECASYRRQRSETFETKPNNTVVDLLFEHGEWIKCFPPNIQHVMLDLQMGHGSACLCFATDRTCSWPPSESECSLHVSKTWD